jgi:signal transduction histidine kinase
MPGGTITVHAAYDRTSREVVIDVKDDGPGIPAETLARLFRRSAQQHRGGLGLSLVHDILVAHGGGVEVRSSTDAFEHGTTIRLSLPSPSPLE